LALLLDKARDTLDVNQANKEGHTPLIFACDRGHKEVVALLLDKARHTLDVNQADKKGYTPLLLACAKGHKEVVTLLLARDDIDVSLTVIYSGQEFTPLSVSIKLGHTHIAQLLRDHQVISASHDACPCTPGSRHRGIPFEHIRAFALGSRASVSICVSKGSGSILTPVLDSR
jgi:ankyrin repeat protein